MRHAQLTFTMTGEVKNEIQNAIDKLKRKLSGKQRSKSGQAMIRDTWQKLSNSLSEPMLHECTLIFDKMILWKEII